MKSELRKIMVLIAMCSSSFIFAQTTYYSKSSATNFNDVNSWGINADGSGAAPAIISSADFYIVQNASALTLSAPASVGKLTITSGSLTVAANELTIAISGQNSSTLLVNGGTLNLSGTGSIVLNGNFSMSSGTFNQTGGTMTLDGNNGNVAASSVPSATHLFSMSGGTPNCSAGTITIVDPPVNTYTAGTTRAISLTLAANTTGFSGTHTFVLGDGVSTTPGNTDGFAIETYASGIVYINNVTVNAGSATGRWGAGSYSTTAYGTYIKGTLTINTGSEFRVNQTVTSTNVLVVGSVVNNGIFTTGRASGTPTLFIGSQSTATWNPIAPSTISGTGVFRNLATSPTASFNLLTIVNPLGVTFAPGTLALGTYTGHVSGTLTLTAGAINTNGQEFVLGTGTGTLGSLTYTAGGFTSGSIFSRWWAAATAGTTITASTAPTAGTGTYPFVSGVNNRSLHINRPVTTGAVGGVIKVQYTDASGMATIPALTDGTYTVDRQSNASWTISTGSSFAAGTGTFSYAINGQGIYVPLNANGRLTKNGSITGTHQAGTNLPIVQRTGITAANFTGTFNVGVGASDIPLQSVQSGAFEDPATWGGTVPSCSTTCAVMSSHTITVSISTTGSCAGMIVGLNGTLAVNGGSLTIGCTNNNATFSNSGTFNISGGSLTVNGNISNAAGSAFTQSGGEIIVDGNNGNVTATSVATLTPLVSFASNTLTLTGGKLTIVDPHAGAGTETAIAYTPSTSPYPTVTTGHTTQFGDGISTTTGGSTSGFRVTQGTRLALGNVIVNTLSGRFVYASANLPIYGNLTITSGEFQIQAGNIGLVAGSIINNGTLTTIGTLYLGTYTPPSTLAPTTLAQSISGTGVFRNATTTSTANFATLTVNNTNSAGVTFANANSLVNGTNTGTVSGTLTITSGVVNTSGNTFVLGTAVGTLGTLTVTAGGFTSGSIFSRWFPTATGGTTITAGTAPSASTAGAFPFVTSNNLTRAFFIQQTTAPTLGGRINVAYNGSTGGTTPVSFADGTYNIETRSNENWTVTQTGITGTPVYTFSLSAQNLYGAINGNSRITLASAPAAGSHQLGSALPNAQRSGIALSALADTYYIGVANADVPFQAISSGNWEDGTIWNKGVAPSCSDIVIIPSGNIVTVNSTPASCQNLTIASGGTVVVSGSSLTTGCTLNNNTLTNSGTLTVSGGLLTINGNLNCLAGSTFNQIGGEIMIDGNGGTTGTNVASGVSLCQLSSQFINWTGGRLTIVDPHANATASESFTYTNSTAHANVTAGHTIRFGDGISTDAGGNATNGFRINTWPGSNRISFFNFEVNSLGGINRHVTTAWSFGISGSMNIISGEFRDNATTVYIAQNLNNNGTYIATGTLNLATYLSATVAPTSQVQTISGTGVFSNNVTLTSKTADLTNLTINNTNTNGVVFDRSLSLSGTLTMTSGISTINAPYVLQLGTATTAGTLSGTPSVTNMIKGVFARTFATTRTATGTYTNATLYPLGSGSSYLPIFIDPTTGSTGASSISATAFDSNTGTGGNGVTAVANVRWEYSNAAANLNSAFIRVTHSGVGSGKVFLQSPTSAGVYDPIPSVISTVSGTNLTSSAVPASAMTGILSYGDLIPCNAPVDQAAAWTTSVLSTTSLSATLSAAPSAPTGYLVVRYPSGATPQNPVNFTSYATGAALGTGTVVYYGTSLSFNVSGLVAGTGYDFYVYAFNAGSCAGPVYNTVSPLLSTVTTCATATNAPVSAAGTLITNSSFQANWTISTSAGVTDQFLEVSTSATFASFVAGYPVSVGAAANSYPVIGLNGNTTYYYRIRAVVGLCSSAYSTSQTVLTDCSPISLLPHTQNFATYLPSCWKNFGQGGTPATGPTVTTTGSWAADGFLNVGTTGATKVNIYSTSMRSWLISPAFDLSTGAYVLKYKVGLTVWGGTTSATLGSDDEVQVLISTNGGLTWTSIKTYNASTPISNLGTQELIDISAYSSNNVKIAFWANEGTFDDTADNDFFIDDFMIDNAPTCYNPVSLNSTNITATSVDFSWSAPVSGTTPVGYNWEIRTSGAGGSGPTGLVDFGSTLNTFASSTLGILLPNTSYSIYVQTDCGSGLSSSWTGPLSIATPCLPISALPWTEGFEGITTVGATAFPACWKKENGDWQSATASTNTYNDPRSGTKYITESWSATNEWIWTPPFDLVAGTAYNFNFWFAGDGLAGWTGEVGYNTVQGSVGATILGTPFITSTTTSVTSYQQVSNLFIAPTSGTYYFGIRINANSTPWYLGFDDFSLDVAPTCFNPTALVTGSVTSSAVNFSWNAPVGGASPVAYNWEIRTSGAAGSGAAGLVDSGNTSNTFASSTPGLLQPTTSYSIYVQTDCGSGTSSSWIGPLNITTPCQSITTLPWNEGFEGITTVGTTAFPPCWKKENGDWQSATAATNTYNDPRTGTKYITETYSATNEWIWTPPFDLVAGTAYNFNFWFVGDGLSGWTGEVGYNTNQNSTGATILGTPFITSTTTSSTSYQQVSNTFVAPTSGTYYFGIRINASLTPWYLGFDDFSLEVAPTCFTPTGVVTSNITSSSVDFSWSAPTGGNPPLGYNYEIRTSGAPGSGNTGLRASGNTPNTFVSIAPGTLNDDKRYSIYIQVDCGNGNTSAWFGPVNFRTLCASIATLPWTEGFESLTSVGATVFPSCWKKENGDWQSATATTNTYNDPRSGTYYITESWSATNEWMWTPSFRLNAGSTYKFSFWFAGDGLAGWTGDVGYNTSQISTGATILGAPFVAATTTTSNVYQNVSRTFTPLTTGDYFFGVRINATSVPWYLGFDDFSLEELPPCTSAPDPASINSSTSSVCAGSSVVLTASGLNTINSGVTYQWQYSDDNGVTWFDFQGPVSGTSTSSVTVTNVTVSTLYRLNGICAAGGTSSSNQIGVTIATVTGGKTSATLTNVCSSTTTSNTTLSLIGATAGVTYQWQSSANGVVYTDITGATSATYSATVSSTTYFQCVVTCGTSTAISTPEVVTLNPANQCYCIPLHSGSSCISNVSIGTINNNSPTCVAPYYSVQTATTDLKRGTAYNLTVTTVDAAILSVWIDYNQNGVFEASEWNQITTASTAGSPVVKSISIPSTALLGKTGMRIRSRSTGSANGAGDACTQFFSGECEDYFVTITDPFPTVAAKVFLGNVNPQTGLMNDYLRSMFNFPLSDPYSTSPLNLSFVHVNNGSNPATMSPQVLNVSGNNAIVDWVFLELRNGPSGATSVQYTRSALLQADGDIVDVDGTSRVGFPNAVAGDYYVTVRHRNHLGFRTANTVAVNSSTQLLNFTNNSVQLNGAYPLTAVGPTVSAMNSGDSNSDGSIDSIDSIYWETQNGLFDDYLLNAEYNLDGSVDSIDTIVWETNNGKYQELD